MILVFLKSRQFRDSCSTEWEVQTRSMMLAFAHLWRSHLEQFRVILIWSDGSQSTSCCSFWFTQSPCDCSKGHCHGVREWTPIFLQQLFGRWIGLTSFVLQCSFFRVPLWCFLCTDIEQHCITVEGRSQDILKQETSIGPGPEHWIVPDRLFQKIGYRRKKRGT